MKLMWNRKKKEEISGNNNNKKCIKCKIYYLIKNLHKQIYQMKFLIIKKLKINCKQMLN